MVSFASKLLRRHVFGASRAGGSPPVSPTLLVDPPAQAGSGATLGWLATIMRLRFSLGPTHRFLPSCEQFGRGIRASRRRTVGQCTHTGQTSAAAPPGWVRPWVIPLSNDSARRPGAYRAYRRCSTGAAVRSTPAKRGPGIGAACGLGGAALAASMRGAPR
jgi:hypothetical protein